MRRRAYLHDVGDSLDPESYKPTEHVLEDKNGDLYYMRGSTKDHTGRMKTEII